VDGIDIGLVTIDNPPVNAGSRAMRRDLLAAVNAAANTVGLSGVVLTGANGNFMGGSDIREFDAPAWPPHLPEVIAAIEACRTPVVAAIDGAALGGGYELALGCDGRVVTPRAVLGLPEVTLGLIPGAGGTLRLSRLVGIAEAIRLVTSGRRVRGAEAVSLGMADVLAEGDPVNAAAHHIARFGGTKRVLRALPAIGSERSAVEAAEKEARRKAAGSDAVDAAILAVHRGAASGAEEALAEERATALRLRAGEQSKALRYLFFAERAALKLPANVSPRPIGRVGVVGAGQMGRGIALAFAGRGYSVRLADTDADFLAAALEILRESARQMAGKGRIASEEALMSMIVPGALEDMRDCDLVVEAIVEDLGAKKALFAELDRICRQDAILASNTSYLDINILAAQSSRPQRVAGLHFFNPANVMRLVEVIPGKAAGAETEVSLIAVSRRLGKVPVVAGASEGFIGNRIFSAYRRQCEFLVEEGALPEDVDRAMREFGMAMGPFAVFDLAGLDIAWATRKRLAPERDPRARYVTIADSLCEIGRFGRKTNAGWYDYSRLPMGEPDPVVQAIIEKASVGAGIERRSISDAEIQSRLLAAIVNEAALVLEQKIARSPCDIDLVLVHGYGFPAIKGGPLYHAAHQPRETIIESVREMARRSGFTDTATDLPRILDSVLAR
jgi:3-hydroxyacyl-CoA dehydrogenase